MFNEILNTIRSDSSDLYTWYKNEPLLNSQGKPLSENDQQNRIRAAAARMLAVIAAAYAAYLTLNLITFVVTFPITILLKLALAVSMCAVVHDVFVMFRNSANQSKDRGAMGRFVAFVVGQTEEEKAKKLTHGTLLQQAWVWVYLKRNAMKVD
jgi:hypothetical protein